MLSPSRKVNNRLWITRIKRGLARKKLAGLLGLRTTSQLCRWEDGSQIPTLQNALLVSYLLQMPVEFLFKGLRDDLVGQVEARRQLEGWTDDEDDFAAEPGRIDTVSEVRYEKRGTMR